MENQFDLGFNIASIETELPDPVITLTGADALTASETAEAPLLSLKAYGRSWQSAEPTVETPADISSIGDSGSLTITTYGKNLIDPEKLIIRSPNGVSVTRNDNGTFTFSGLKSDINKPVNVSWEMTHEESRRIFTPGTYSMSGVPYEHRPGLYGYLTVVYNDQTSFNYIRTAVGYDTGIITKEMWSAEDFKITLGLYSAIGSEIINDTVYLQIERNDTATSYEPYRSAEAAIITGLPLRGVPVSNGGNYTDENGQQWICDTLDHAYGEPAQVTRRIHTAEVIEHYDLKGGGAIFIDSSFNQWYYAERGELYITSWGEELVKLYGAFLREQRTASGELTEVLEEWEPPREVTSNYYSGHKLIGKWTVYKDVEILPAYELTNGEPVPDDFISTTGRLSQGAEIIYPAKAETILLTTAETEALNSLSGYSGSTSVYNENTAEMTVKLLREDYEMQYIHWIKESQSFVCEKSGKYKIICVGGGSSGGLGAVGAGDTLQAVGTTTSFGTIISADGGGKTRASADSSFGVMSTTGGQSGYDGINYGSTAHVMCTAHSISSAGAESAVMWGTGHGYGAGGGAKGISGSYNKGSTGESITFAAAAGKCGKVESTIVDLEENQSVFCTIGGGGVLKVSESDVLNYIKNAVDPAAVSVTIDADAFSACASDGADGVIIIQYLGI